jgi:hypothetical protein
MSTIAVEPESLNTTRKAVIPKHVAASIEGDFVVFLIGMRINKWWKPHKWLPTLRAMRPMLEELSADPASGLLGFHYVGKLTFVQYWRSFDHLEAYARAQDRLHWKAWTKFNSAMKNSRGDVGIWHETYLIKAGQYEAVYSGMPRQGLGSAGRLMDTKGPSETARNRIASARNQLFGDDIATPPKERETISATSGKR